MLFIGNLRLFYFRSEQWNYFVTSPRAGGTTSPCEENSNTAFQFKIELKEKRDTRNRDFFQEILENTEIKQKIRLNVMSM